eukprot:7574311-Heterocapsa_arctica.AAC.1
MGHTLHAKGFWQSILHINNTMEEFGWQKTNKWIEICDISAQRFRHRKPAPQTAVTLGAARDGLDDEKWENADSRITTGQGRTGSSSTARSRVLREHE